MPSTQKPWVVLVTCDDNYVRKALAALKLWQAVNTARPYEPWLYGRVFSAETKTLCQTQGVRTKEEDLTKWFPRHPKVEQYPAECFWHFGAARAFRHYADRVVVIDGDILALKPFPTGEVQATTHAAIPRSSNTHTLSSIIQATERERLGRLLGVPAKRWGSVLRGNTGVLVLNPAGLDGYLEEVSWIYRTCTRYRMPRKGDDSLFALYQARNPGKVRLLGPELNYHRHRALRLPRSRIVCVHFTADFRKPWGTGAPASALDAELRETWQRRVAKLGFRVL